MREAREARGLSARNRTRTADGVPSRAPHATSPEPLRQTDAAEPLDENFEDLANAIIIQQAEDYRKCRKILRPRPGKKQVSFFVQDEANKRLREIEVFFQSWWFSRLTTADGKMILERLKKEEDENDSKGVSAAGLSA
jgi:hypothetical protein